jgi:hypothetical protein
MHKGQSFPTCKPEEFSCLVTYLLIHRGIHLTDLTFIDEGNPTSKGDLINFKKQRLTARVIQQIQYFQGVPFNNDIDLELCTYLKELSALDDEGLYQLSLTREPRNAEIFDII